MTPIAETCTSPAPACESPAARVLLRLAGWQETRYRRRMQRAGLYDIPESLRGDLGLDGGAPLRPVRGGGRTFVHGDAGEPGALALWWARWVRRRAEKNRRYKIPGHFGIEPDMPPKPPGKGKRGPGIPE